MPQYDYRCIDCAHQFSVFQSLTQHGKEPVQCPACRSGKTERVFTGFFAKTASKT
ncbi:MAG: zinc ribbon domain-containing protein [Nitrospirota bacterium]